MTMIRFSKAARENIAETSCDPEADVQAILDGTHTGPSLLAHCLDGAEDDRVAGWREYVLTVCETANDRAVRAREEAFAEKLRRGTCAIGTEERDQLGRVAAEAVTVCERARAALAAAEAR